MFPLSFWSKYLKIWNKLKSGFLANSHLIFSVCFSMKIWFWKNCASSLSMAPGGACEVCSICCSCYLCHCSCCCWYLIDSRDASTFEMFIWGSLLPSGRFECLSGSENFTFTVFWLGTLFPKDCDGTRPCWASWSWLCWVMLLFKMPNSGGSCTCAKAVLLFWFILLGTCGLPCSLLLRVLFMLRRLSSTACWRSYSTVDLLIVDVWSRYIWFWLSVIAFAGMKSGDTGDIDSTNSLKFIFWSPSMSSLLMMALTSSGSTWWPMFCKYLLTDPESMYFLLCTSTILKSLRNLKSSMFCRSSFICSSFRWNMISYSSITASSASKSPRRCSWGLVLIACRYCVAWVRKSWLSQGRIIYMKSW